MRYMGEAKRYADEARQDKMTIEQVKEDITTKVEAVNSQFSSAQDRKTVLHLETPADTEISKDINVQIREGYLKSKE